MKILIILSIILSSFCLKANDTANITCASDTSFVTPHYNADSVVVVKVVKGVVSVVPIFVNRPLFVRLLSQPEFTAVMTALILGLVRGIERSRMRRKTRNKDNNV